MKKHIIFVAICTLLLFSNLVLYSQFTINAYVSTFSTTSLSYSDYYYREVNVITGVILRSRTQNQNFDGNADYILVRFSQTEVAVIKLRENLFDFGQRINFNSMDESSFRMSIMYKKNTWDGYDQVNSKWRICFANEYGKYNCETKKDDLYYLLDGAKTLSVIINDYNRILESCKGSNLNNCENYKSQLNTIESQAKELKDRFEYHAFFGNDPYWEKFLEFLRSCTEVEKKSNELYKTICKE
jgi:hypothetical protein